MKSTSLENWTPSVDQINNQISNIASTMGHACEALKNYRAALEFESPRLPQIKQELYDALTAIENCGLEFSFIPQS